MPKASDAPRRAFVYAGIEDDDVFHAESSSSENAEASLAALLRSALRWASPAEPAEPARPACSAALPAAAPRGDVPMGLSKDEREYFQAQAPEWRTLVADQLQQLRAYEVFAAPLRFRVVQSLLPLDLKQRILQKLDRQQDASSGEALKYYGWIEGLLSLPLVQYVVPQQPLPAAREALQDARAYLDSVIFGHRSAKQAMLERFYLWLSSPMVPQRPLALQGCPGNGKTTLIREGLAVIMNRPFSLVALGGSFDSSSLLGHGFTYEGSTPGRLAECLISSRCMNPMIFFDELDKVSATPKGDEITNALLHVTDLSQNAAFRDRYFAGVDLDLSRALFVFSFNDASKISPVLLDRLQVVQTDAFDPREQANILRDYLLPRVLAERGLPPDFLVVAGGALSEAVYACAAGGVRALRSVLEQVLCKACIWRDTEDASLLHPLRPEDLARTGAGYELRGGVARLLDEARKLDAPPPGMYC